MTFEYLDRALTWILEAEGGFVDHPADPGGATNRGITQATYDRWRDRIQQPRLPVRDLTVDEAKAIYTSDYWLAGRCPSLPWPVALVHFDGCVNSGVGAATRMLQRVLGVEADGIVGPVTLAAVNTKTPRDLAEGLCWHRALFYAQIVRSKPSQSAFIVGWIKRLRELRQRFG